VAMLMSSRLLVAFDFRVSARSEIWPVTLRVSPMVVLIMSYHVAASSPVFLVSGADGFTAESLSARSSREVARSTAAPVTVLLKSSCSVMFVEALKSARSVLSWASACCRLLRSSGPSTAGHALSAAYKMARCTYWSFSTRSSAAKVVTVACKDASRVPPATAALNVFPDR
jgi:hypothetical protein